VTPAGSARCGAARRSRSLRGSTRIEAWRDAREVDEADAMRWLPLLSALAACGGTTHVGTSSPQVDEARRKRFVEEQCSVLDGVRHLTCLRLGPPRAPMRDQWRTATWWLYESRHWETVADDLAASGPQVVCASYVAFEQDRVVESDEQCHRVKHYEP
jgi:hypothetical protein